LDEERSDELTALAEGWNLGDSSISPTTITNNLLLVASLIVGVSPGPAAPEDGHQARRG